MLVGVINYGLGNISAFQYALKKLNCEVNIISHCDDINSCSHLILPGVGAFDYAIELLKSSGMLDIINKNVLLDKKPILGVCVGMQIFLKIVKKAIIMAWVGSKGMLENLYQVIKILLNYLIWGGILLKI